MEFSTGTLIGLLFLFTLGGGILHAWYNKRKTHELKEEHEVPYEIPKVYQKYRHPSEKYADKPDRPQSRDPGKRDAADRDWEERQRGGREWHDRDRDLHDREDHDRQAHAREAHGGETHGGEAHDREAREREERERTASGSGAGEPQPGERRGRPATGTTG